MHGSPFTTHPARRIHCAGLTAVLIALSTLSSGADITTPALERDLTVLSSDRYEGREVGQPGGKLAAEYVAGQFERCGLQSLGADGFMQDFRVQTGSKPGPGNRVQWGAAELAYDREVRAMGFSASGTATAPVVFAGYGLATANPNGQDYRDLDVRGKLVLVLSGYPGPRGSDGTLGKLAWPRAKARMAEEQGAVGLLYVRCSTDADGDDLEPFDASAARSPVGIPVVSVTRAACLQQLPPEYAGILAEQGDALAGRRGEIVGQVTLSTDVESTTAPARNVVGLLPGSDPVLRWECVAVGAHYDHVGVHPWNQGGPGPQVFNGADDNASGTSGVLALARSLSACEPRPKRSILFLCFDAEEEGLFGSSQYVKSPLLPLDKTVAMVNLDMVGRLRDDQLYVFATGSSPQFGPLLTPLGEKHRLRLRIEETAPSGSDHMAFLSAGIPVAFFFTGLHADYHTPRDDVGLINVEGEARVLGLVEDFIRSVADAPERPSFGPSAR
jgi:aminopeptidase YwaD